ncbi:MAG: hypothetical protein NVS3B28_26840 [Candidatus Velthaea sp.]
MIAAVLALHLALEPYRGAPLPGTVAGTPKFGVRIEGAPGSRVVLRSTGLPAGWIASFCTKRVCAPFHVFVDLPSSGRDTIELQLIQSDTKAAAPAVVSVEVTHGPRARIRFSRATR